MSWVMACGIFFLCGGVLFFAAALSLCRGRQIVPVTATVVAVRTGDGDEAGETEYEYADGETKVRVVCPLETSVPAGGTETMYLDRRRGALYHRRLPRALFTAAAGFAGFGVLAIVLGALAF